MRITLNFTSFRVHNLKKFDNTGEDLEDLISIGTIGLIKAIESFFVEILNILKRLNAQVGRLF
ncbi:hypothetical protein GC102_06475 [Paenibacillus sp. LMG 31460]|uniref:RNA polymerase sigma-70 domain-containing protein n=1 Tax=Paenibacillus germinis TaxID=2654979 RepID=A0ABX1YXY8_9BACL|nr:hypothetical protein [Paenibacillus germinis]NOU85424.1 hypothetical protein [Paenibacillus germinis]